MEKVEYNRYPFQAHQAVRKELETYLGEFRVGLNEQAKKEGILLEAHDTGRLLENLEAGKKKQLLQRSGISLEEFELKERQYNLYKEDLADLLLENDVGLEQDRNRLAEQLIREPSRLRGEFREREQDYNYLSEEETAAKEAEREKIKIEAREFVQEMKMTVASEMVAQGIAKSLRNNN